MASSITQEETGGVTGTGVSQVFPSSYYFVDGTYVSQGVTWSLGYPSAVYTPLSAIITDASNIMNGIVTVKLTAPSGTTGDVFLNLYGTVTYAKQFSSLGPGSQDLELDFDFVQPDIYKTANGQWDAGANGSAPVYMPTYTLSPPWTYFRKIFYTQYNVLHEDQCEGGNTGDTDAWIVSTAVVKGKTTCNFTKIKLNSQFIAATWMNGTGVDNGGDILKNAFAAMLASNQATCRSTAFGGTVKWPDGAIGYGGAGGNAFAMVSSITGSTGSCGSTLVPDQSLAMPAIEVKVGNKTKLVPSVLSNVQALSCGDQLNLDHGDYTTAATRTVDDMCPKCSQSSTFEGADGH